MISEYISSRVDTKTKWPPHRLPIAIVQTFVLTPGHTKVLTSNQHSGTQTLNQDHSHNYEHGWPDIINTHPVF